MNNGKILVYVWHNCMKCMVKGLENYLTWFFRVSEDKEVFLLNEEGNEKNLPELLEILEKVDVIVSSCSSFEPTELWKSAANVLENKRWFVVHKACEINPEEQFRNTEVYKWLNENRKVVHIAENHITDLNEKVKDLKNKPRLNS